MLTYAAAMFVAWLLIRIITGIRLDYVGGLIIYGTILTLRRWTLGCAGACKKAFSRVPKRERPRLEPITRVTQYESRYRLKLFEVILSNSSFKLVKADFHSHHTLIGASSGWGKTNLINSILVQLFNKGKKFVDACDVYLIDLKGDENDYLHLWKPVLAGYFSISERNNVMERVIHTLNGIIEDMHRRHKEGDSEKRILVIIDEIAMLTTMSSDKAFKGDAIAALNRLSGQLRSRGTIIAATQYPKYDVLPTSSRFNMDRRICLYVNNTSEGQVVLGTKPRPDELATQKGEFLLREPGKPGLIKGHAMLVDIPAEIDRVVYGILDRAIEDDIRLRLFREVTEGREVCEAIVGMNKVYKSMGMSLHEVKVAYRHFALAGAFEPPKTEKGSSYHLLVPYEEGFTMVRRYIEEGNWHNDPESLAGKKTMMIGAGEME